MEEPNDIWTPERIDHDRWGDWVPHKDVTTRSTRSTYVGGGVRGGGRSCTTRWRPRWDDAARVLRPARRAAPARAVMSRRRASPTWTPTASTRSCCTRAWRCSSDRATRSPRSTTPRSSPTASARTTTGSPSSARTSPTRLFGVAAVPLQDVARACAEVEHAVAAGLRGVFVRPSAYVDELPLNHHVYDDFWSTCEELGVPVAFHPGRARRHARRVPQVRARRDQRERDDHEHGDGRDPRRFRARPGGRQPRRHDRDDGPPADGRRVRAVPAAQAGVPRIERRVDAVDARTHGRAGAGVPAREALALAAAERVLRTAVLRQLRARGMEPRRRRPRSSAPTGSCGRPTTRTPSTTRESSTSSASASRRSATPTRRASSPANAIECYGLCPA